MKLCKSQSCKKSGIIWAFTVMCLALMLSGPAGAAAKKTYFTGTEYETIADWGTWITDGGKVYISDGTMSSDEIATDPRVTGEGTINVSAIWDAATWTGPMWGKFHIENDDGEWNGYWQGRRWSVGQDVHSSIMATAVGSCAYADLVARWNYSGVNVDQTGQLSISGFIVEAKGGPGYLPLQFSATRTERFELHPGLVITPPAVPPYSPGLAGTWDILEETAQASHAGRSENTGMGLYDPLTGMLSGSGCLKAANGDLAYWVISGQADFETGQAAITGHFTGGTGRFEGVVGDFSSAISAELQPTQDPLVFIGHYSYAGTGTIRY